MRNRGTRHRAMKRRFLWVGLVALLTACPAPPDTTPPSTPSGFKATASNAKVKLEWNASSAADLDKYTLRWGSDPAQQNATQAIAKTSTQFEQTGLTNGTTYYFKLEATNTAGKTSDSTALVSATPVALDNTAPTLVSSLPTSNASNVALNTQVQLSFSEGMNPGSVSVSSNNLTLGTATWNVANTNVSFATPALQFDTTYSLQLSGQDLAGNNLPSDTLQFSTISAPPTVSSVAPNNNATSTPIVSSITWRFSKSMNRNSVQSGFSSTPSVVCAWAWLDNDQTATCTPSSVLAFDTLYNLNLSTSAQSALGVALTSAFSSSFRTVRDLVQPALVSFAPADNATDVVFSSPITLSFSKPMNQVAVQSAFQSSPAIACIWTWTTSQSASCQPNGRLEQQTDYQITLSSNATDLVGNTLQAAYGFRFRTGNAPPKVTAFTPNGVSLVSNNATLVITFSEDMNKTATEAALRVVNQNAVKTGTISWNPECVLFSGVWVNCRIVSFTPSTGYVSGSSVTWTVSADAVDFGSGARLESAISRDFNIRPSVGP